MNILRLDLAAREFLKVPFRHQGRDPAIGLDCIGLLCVAAYRLGVNLWVHDDPSYARNPANGILEQRLQQAFGSRSRQLEPGCVVAIDFKGQTRHVGIVGEYAYGGLSLIHTSSSSKWVAENRLSDPWARRITGVYALEASA